MTTSLSSTLRSLSFEKPLPSNELVAPGSYLVLVAVMVFMLLLTWGLGTNTEWFLALNHQAAETFSPTFSAHATELGNGAIVGILALFFVVRRPDLAKRLLIVTLLSAIVMAGLKHLFSAPRPAGVLPIQDFYIVGDILKRYAFPSGHTTTAFALAGFLMLSYQNTLFRVGIFGLACLAGWARIAVGAHWPEDIFAGAALGLLLALIAVRFSGQPFSARGNYFTGLFLGFAALAGNLTLPADFPEIISIGRTRILFAVLAVGMILYFTARLLLLIPAINDRVYQFIGFLDKHQNTLPLRFMKFGMVGGSGFVVDSIVYFVAQALGVNHSVARIISYWCAATNNWFLNRIFTFNDASRDEKFRQWVKYMAMCGFSFVLNWGSYHILTSHVEYFIEHKFVAFLIGIGLGMIANFTISHLIIFKEKNQKAL